MHTGGVAVVVATVYIGILFAIAFYGDRAAARWPERSRPNLYALAIPVYCTSWTFFGSVGLAATSGLDFLPIYIGPILMFTVGYPILKRVVRLCKAERITSVADLLGARYGKSQAVAVVATVIAVIGAVPYIALQLKAVSSSVSALVPALGNAGDIGRFPVFGDIALLVACALALFAILFGTRHTDATEHQDGMMLAVATEAVVKLIAFLVVGVYVTFALFDGPGDLLARAMVNEAVTSTFRRDLSGGTWIAMTMLAFFAVILLPRQFHIVFVENNTQSELRRAAWMFPAYLVAINLFVVPIAVAGTLTFGSTVDGDLFVLELPNAAGSSLIALIAFLGGLSAATAMVIVASVALGIMISNEIVLPAVVRRRRAARQPADMGRFILNVRRTAIIAVLLLGYGYYRVAGTAALASIGLLSFAAIAQLAPAFFGGLLWRRATARGVIGGMCAGLAVWAYTLLVPTFASAGLIPMTFIENGPFGLSLFRPQALFAISFDPLTHGVFWSLLANVTAMVLGSVSRPARLIERLQANVFVPADRNPSPVPRRMQTNVTVGELIETVARYLGPERTKRSFERFRRETGRTAQARERIDHGYLQFAEQILASAVGAASSRLILSLLVNRDRPAAAHELLSEASEALHYNRDLLQTVLDRMADGAAAFDADLRLICWNKPFRALLDLPAEFGQVGTSLTDIFRHLSTNGFFGEGEPAVLADERIQPLVGDMQATVLRHSASGKAIEVKPDRIDNGGLTLTFRDISQQVRTETELNRANVMLEKRVAERTAELERLNAALEKANSTVEEANIGKTRFIAAAGHDILQPLNAARLYATALVERLDDNDQRRLAGNLEAALDSVEDIFKAVLELSRLDTGHMKPDIQAFAIRDLLDKLKVEFEPLARTKGLELRIVPSSLTVRSDPHLLHRLAQNLVSNAIKYTPSGRIVVGCRRRRGAVSLEIADSGIGIAEADRKKAFVEFQRLDAGAREAPGLGLGLSIVQRIADALDCALAIHSVTGRGTRATVAVPLAHAAPAADRRPAPAAANPAATAGMVVVCIDNDKNILAGMKALLTGWKSRPVLAADGKEARKRLMAAQTEPDLLLVDYHLDDGNGLTAIADLRWKFGADIPAILITADRSEEVRTAAAQAGVRVLNKPVKPAALRALMAQWSGRMEAQTSEPARQAKAADFEAAE